jgi:hypothetical protein
MHALSLYCKSFSTDLKRVVRLAKSISQFNLDNLNFIVSVPRQELSLFKEHLQKFDVTLLTDEEIIRASKIDPASVLQLPGSISQQIIKSEFWRLGLSDAYLCLDSDSIFIRPFKAAEFIASDGTPYTVMNEAHDLLFAALTKKKFSVIDNFRREATTVQELFERHGKAYSFGPMPMVWHRAVWESLECQYLKPHGLNFADAIKRAPLESRWYGEALFKFKAIPLMPSEPFFKVYHYAWQLDKDRRRHIDQEQLAKIYSGVIYQSSWEREMDWPNEGGNRFSWIARRLRRKLGRV